MKKYIATFWRENPQLANGGYITKREIKARTMKNAEKQAEKYAARTAYGSMTLQKIEESEEN